MASIGTPSNETPGLEAVLVEPRLPYELERLIFEDAARMSRSDITTLIVVCQRVKIWVEPILYSVVVRHEEKTSVYCPPLEGLPSYAQHVHAILIYWEIDETILHDHLKLCTNLTNVSFWCSSLCPDALQLLEQLPNLRRLVTYLSSLFQDSEGPYDLDHPVFHRLTHLELMDDDITWDMIKGMADLQNLTHFALNDIAEEDIVWGFISNCPKLKVFVVFESKSLEENMFKSDSRVVFASSSLEEYIDDWAAGAEGKECLWDRAEIEIEEKCLAK